MRPTWSFVPVADQAGSAHLGIKNSICQLETLQAIVLTTFEETFRTNYCDDDYHAYVKERLSIDALSAEREDPTAFFTLVVADETPAGYLKWNVPCRRYLPDSLTCQVPFNLERFYFLKAFQGMGIGPVALQYVLSQARYVHAADYIYLTVWEKNFRAQKFYQEAGFRTLTQVIYPVGNAQDIEFVYGMRV
ncbi:MAG: GNAT family N-acetyltransferase [Vampirovibrionales bacterium]|nr:GNAT family N-acetyltransferase [Vampirovibrionales bacterium]